MHYSLGLLLAEERRYREGAGQLEKAVEGVPDFGRMHYNPGQLLDFMQPSKGPKWFSSMHTNWSRRIATT